ncbi:MAG: PQQ-binding-like beta-propeller repeat protein [Fimbriimonadaceae bacterium]|nr:PQQ-binding-like beta-propeller repeat protein [Fimbriimonadaceae bacterium]
MNRSTAVLALLALSGSAFAQPPNSPWPLERQDRWGTAKALDGPATYSTPWISKRFSFDKIVSHGPSLGPNNLAFYGSWVDNRLNKLNLSNTTIFPEFFSALNFIQSTPAIGNDGTLYFTTTRDFAADGRLFAINPVTMDFNWFFNASITKVNDYESASPIIGPDGSVLVVSTNGRVTCLNPATGGTIWFRQLGSCKRTPAFTRNDAFVLVADGSNLRALNYTDGTIAWTRTLPSTCGAPGSAPDGTVVVGSDDGTVYGLNPATGAINWSFLTLAKTPTAPAFDGAFAYITSYDDRLYKFNTATGVRSWSYSTGSGQWNTAPPVVGFDGRIYFHNRVSRFFSINPDGTLQWTVDLQGEARGPMSIGPDGTLYVGRNGGGQYSGLVLLRQSPAMISGQIVYNGLDGPLPATALIEVRQGTSTTTVASQVVNLDGSGNFNAAIPMPFIAGGNSVDGQFNVSVKRTHWLRRTLNVDLATTSASGLVFSLVNGDCSGDNDIDIGDYSILSAAYGSDPSSGNWNPNADLNEDGAVDIGDYAILSSNYGQSGNG